MDPGLGTILGSGLGVISSLFSNLFGKNENELSYRRQLDMWNKQNEYNHPAAQMARLAQAGLNPHLVYGNGNVANSVSSSSPKYTPTKFDPYTQFGSLGAMEQVVANNQTRQTDSNVKEANARIEKIIQEKLDIEEKRQQNSQDLLIKQQKVIEYKLKNAKTEVERKYWEEMAYNNNELLKQQVQNVQSQTDLNMANTELSQNKSLLTEAQYHNELEKYNLILAQESYTQAQADYIRGVLTYKTMTETVLLDQKYRINEVMKPFELRKLQVDILSELINNNYMLSKAQIEAILARNTNIIYGSNEWTVILDYATEWVTSIIHGNVNLGVNSSEVDVFKAN